MDRLSKMFLAPATVSIFDVICHAYGELTAYSSFLTTFSHSICDSSSCS